MQVAHAPAQQRVGQQCDAVNLDAHRRMAAPDDGQPRRCIGRVGGIAHDTIVTR